MSNGTPLWSWNLRADGRVLAIGRDREKKTVIVDISAGEVGFVPDKRHAHLPGHQPFVGGRGRERVITHDGSFVTTTDMEGEIKLWRLGEFRPRFDISKIDFTKSPVSGKELVKGKSFAGSSGWGSPNHPQLTIADSGAVLVASFVQNGATRENPYAQKGHWQLEELGSGRPPFAFTPGFSSVFQFGPGTRLAAVMLKGGPAGSDAEVWDLQRREMIWMIPGRDHGHQSTHGLFSPDGARLFLFDGEALGSSGGRQQTRRPLAVSVWELAERKKVCTFNVPEESVTAWPVPIARDGSRMLCGTRPGRFQATGRRPRNKAIITYSGTSTTADAVDVRDVRQPKLAASPRAVRELLPLDAMHYEDLMQPPGTDRFARLFPMIFKATKSDAQVSGSRSPISSLAYCPAS